MGAPPARYGEKGPVARSDFDQELPGEERQFRIVISPEDAQEQDLDRYVRTYMARIEKDLGQKLRWAAVNHHNTDHPHAHVVIRGIDTKGREVRMERDYISHGLRGRAAELATQWLGRRPEQSRVDQWTREAELAQYTTLDAVLERRARPGEAPVSRRTDPRLESALQKRLGVLETLGLAIVQERGGYELAPHLREELQRMQRRAEGLRAIGAVLRVTGDRCRVIDRAEPREGHRAELERGVEGVVRWKGLDEQGQFCLVVETTAGAAYSFPISNGVAQGARVGHVVEIKRAIDKDERIEAAARNAGWSYDLSVEPKNISAAYRSRLEQLERMKVATREGPERWRLKETFRAELVVSRNSSGGILA
jgi:type IV secretory pathway VirD2 relaxase